MRVVQPRSRCQRLQDLGELSQRDDMGAQWSCEVRMAGTNDQASHTDIPITDRLCHHPDMRRILPDRIRHTRLAPAGTEACPLCGARRAVDEPGPRLRLKHDNAVRRPGQNINLGRRVTLVEHDITQRRPAHVAQHTRDQCLPERAESGGTVRLRWLGIRSAAIAAVRKLASHAVITSSGRIRVAPPATMGGRSANGTSKPLNRPGETRSPAALPWSSRARSRGSTPPAAPRGARSRHAIYSEVGPRAEQGRTVPPTRTPHTPSSPGPAHHATRPRPIAHLEG